MIYLCDTLPDREYIPVLFSAVVGNMDKQYISDSDI